MNKSPVCVVKPLIALALCTVLTFSACSKENDASYVEDINPFDEDTSYAFGMLIANNFLNLIDHNAFIQGVEDLHNDTARFPAEIAEGIVTEAITRFQTEMMMRSFAEDPESMPDPEPFDEDVSYAFALLITGDDFFALMNHLVFIEGFRDMYEALETRFTLEAAEEKVSEAASTFQETMAAKYLAEGKAFLAENAKRSEVTVTKSGLQYEVLVAGSGAKPEAASTVQVHYEGTLINGTVFDSSYARGEPIEFPLDGVIPGWTEGLQLMPAGSTYKFFIPSDLAYGAGGNQSIPPNSVLIFTVELLDIIDSAE